MNKLGIPENIYYAPDTDLTNLLMEKVVDKLDIPLKKLNSILRKYQVVLYIQLEYKVNTIVVVVVLM